MTGTTEPALPIAQFLWIGSELSRLERLAIRSFLDHGHECHLYAYEDVGQVPAGTVLKDANEVIPRRHIFATSKGYATFSDLFRWELLLRNGQLWIDTDVICLRPFAFDISTQPLLAYEMEEKLGLLAQLGFGKGRSFSLSACIAQSDDLIGKGITTHHRRLKRIGTAVLGFPKGHRLAAHLANCARASDVTLPYDTAWKKIQKRINRAISNDDIGRAQKKYKYGEPAGPIGLTRAAMYFGITALVKPAHYFYPILTLDKIFGENGSMQDVSDSHGLHLWGLLVRRALREKQATPGPASDLQHHYPQSSLFEQLCRKHGID